MNCTSSRRREDQTDSRKRSRSPYIRDDRHVKHARSRSPRSRHHHRTHRHGTDVKLPHGQSTLHKKDFDKYEALFAEYLDLQKHLDLADLGQDEVKGRFKSFVGKWNRNELSEGWYDPALKTRVDERWKSRAKGVSERPRHDVGPSKSIYEDVQDDGSRNGDDDDDDDDGYGPALPSQPNAKAGPYIPSRDDLQYRQELADEARAADRADLRYERKQDRALQRERIEEMAPRADPGSRERQLEKKREVTAVNRDFREAKDGGEAEVGESELMGDDGIEGYKAKLKATEKKKNEREIRKEELLRARAEEREQRMAQYRQKEEKTIEMLRGLARERFG